MLARWKSPQALLIAGGAVGLIGLMGLMLLINLRLDIEARGLSISDQRTINFRVSRTSPNYNPNVPTGGQITQFDPVGAGKKLQLDSERQAVSVYFPFALGTFAVGGLLAAWGGISLARARADMPPADALTRSRTPVAPTSSSPSPNAQRANRSRPT